MTIEDIKGRGCKILPYTSVEEALLHFIEKSRSFTSNRGNTLFHNGRDDKKTGLKPRELFCLAVVANVANFLSGDSWVPGAIVDSDGSVLPGDIAHDGVIKCIDGKKKGQFMWFEQVMATSRDHNAKPDDIESAILRVVSDKSSKGADYGVDEMALIVFTDYSGELSDLRGLSNTVQGIAYKTIFLIAQISDSFKDCVCVVLKSPGDKRGPIRVSFNDLDGRANVVRLR